MALESRRIVVTEFIHSIHWIIDCRQSSARDGRRLTDERTDEPTDVFIKSRRVKVKPPRARDGFVGVSTGARNDDAVPMDVGIDAESAARGWIDGDCRTWTFSDGGVSSTTKRVDDDDDDDVVV